VVRRDGSEGGGRIERDALLAPLRDAATAVLDALTATVPAPLPAVFERRLRTVDVVVRRDGSEGGGRIERDARESFEDDEVAATAVMMTDVTTRPTSRSTRTTCSSVSVPDLHLLHCEVLVCEDPIGSICESVLQSRSRLARHARNDGGCVRRSRFDPHDLFECERSGLTSTAL
jgi:hypothetical protein